MKLYYSPGACSQAPHIILHEIGLHHDAAKVNLKSKTLDQGGSYLQVNPKGAVPALELENGEVITENAVILEYLGDRAASPDYLPPLGDFRRYRVLEAMNFVSTELHKSFGILFAPHLPEETKQLVLSGLGKKLDFLEGQIAGRTLLTGEAFTIADAYLFVMLGWAPNFGMDLSRWPNLQAYRQRLEQRPSVRHVLRFEGLLQEEPAH